MTRDLSRLRRRAHNYGPLAGFVAALLVAAIVLPATDAPGDGNVDASTVDNAAGQSGAEMAGGDQDAATPTTVAASVGGTGGDAAGPGDGAGVPPGAAAAQGAAAGCRPDDGRQAGISRYMPPCVEVFKGDNGGATARGVTSNKITIVRYVNYGDPATRAAASAASTRVVPSQADWEREFAALLRYFNLHYETYGREVVAVTVEATGTDDQSGRADAVRIAQEVGAFAVVPGTGGADTPAFVEELAARGIPCIGCTLGYSRTFYDRTKGHVFSMAPPLEEVYAHLAEYVGKRLARKPARWAGDASMRGQQRKFGLLWIANTFPGGGAPEPGQRVARDFFESELQKHGVTLTRDVSYVYDLARTQEQATNVIVQMKSAGVTTLAWHGDPLSLIVFTREATRQAYFPEWLITAGYASDTTVFGRTYDQAQWRNAFGLSTFWVGPSSEAGQAGYRGYHHGRPGSAASEGTRTTPVIHPTLELLFTGIHMAGPRLTAQTFRDGMYRYPVTGGLNVAPLRFFRPGSQMAIKDIVEVFYDPNRRGPDEAGNEGVGMQVYAENGQRRKLGEWPAGDPRVFTAEGSIISTDDPPTALAHEQDGHTHSATQRCRSC